MSKGSQGFFGFWGRKKTEEESALTTPQDEPISAQENLEVEQQGQPDSENAPANAPHADNHQSSELNKMESLSPQPVQEPEPAEPPPKKSLFARFSERLVKTRDSIIKQATKMFRLYGKIDDQMLEQLEEILISGDLGVETTMDMIEQLREAIDTQNKEGSDDMAWLQATLKQIVRQELGNESTQLNLAPTAPTIILVVGVNGVGKTTTIGKLAYRFKNEGKQVLLCAADTFRAAAGEQLHIWAERAGVAIIGGQSNADPAAVVYDSIQSARAKNCEVVIVDTAGRLHTKANLMKELEKINRIAERECPGAPHETLLVLDASTGQNGLVQAREFASVVKPTGIVLTKLDGTAKGGVTIAVWKTLGIPVKLIGLGEKIEDLDHFNPDLFVDALFAE